MSSLIRMIETERLILRPHRLDDFDAVAAMWADPDVVRHIGGTPFTREESWHRLARYAGLWSLLGRGLFAVIERASGRFVGEVGLARFERGLGAWFDTADEAAWVLGAAVHGRGYAAEAMRAALADHDARTGGARAVCIIHPDNDASLRLAAKLGFAAFGEAAYKGAPVILLERGAIAADAAG